MNYVTKRNKKIGTSNVNFDWAITFNKDTPLWRKLMSDGYFPDESSLRLGVYFTYENLTTSPVAA